VTKQPEPSKLDRTPPQNIELEMCVLGGIMLHPREAYSVAADYLSRDSFYLDGHGIIFEIMGDLHARGTPPDSEMVRDELRSRGLLNKIGGANAVLSMLNAVPTAANVEYHARKVAEKANMRALIRACTQIVEECYRQELSFDDVIGQAESAVLQLSEGSAIGDDPVPIAVSIEEYWQDLWRREALVKERVAAGERSVIGVGLPTGYGDLDIITGGLRPSELTIIAARPSMGKTALALCILRNLVRVHQIPALLFSMEMGEDQISERLLSMGSKYWRGGRVYGVTTDRLRTHRPELLEDERLALDAAREQLAAAPLYIDDASDISVAQLKSKVRRMVSRHGVKVVVLDYLQLMSGAKGENRTQVVSAITRGLKQIARELKIHVVALSQLSRAQKDRKDKYPQLTDLRESGSIEQDADVVIFIHRQSYYDRKERYDPGKVWTGTDRTLLESNAADIIVAKNRNGPTQTVYLAWLGELTLFLNASRAEPL